MLMQVKKPEPVAPESSEEPEAAIVEFMSDDDVLAPGDDSHVMQMWDSFDAPLQCQFAVKRFALVVPGHCS